MVPNPKLYAPKSLLPEALALNPAPLTVSPKPYTLNLNHYIVGESWSRLFLGEGQHRGSIGVGQMRSYVPLESLYAGATIYSNTSALEWFFTGRLPRSR